MKRDSIEFKPPYPRERMERYAKNMGFGSVQEFVRKATSQYMKMYKDKELEVRISESFKQEIVTAVIEELNRRKENDN